MTNQSPEELRAFIDGIDGQLVGLLNERAQIALRLGKAKAKLKTGAYDPLREKTVLEKINGLNAGPLPKGSLEDIYAAILTACREIQARQYKD